MQEEIKEGSMHILIGELATEWSLIWDPETFMGMKRMEVSMILKTMKSQFTLIKSMKWTSRHQDLISNNY